MSISDQWQEIRDNYRLWAKIDPPRCLMEIVHRGVAKYIDLKGYGLTYVGADALEREKPDEPSPDTSI